jgi:hypothetical protein
MMSFSERGLKLKLKLIVREATGVGGLVEGWLVRGPADPSQNGQTDEGDATTDPLGKCWGNGGVAIYSALRFF